MGQQGNYFMWIMLAAILVMFFMMSRSTKKRQAAMREQTERALVPGNWVITRSGMYGRVVDIDGDVVVLETPDGVELLWDKSAVVGEKTPPFADDSSAVSELETPEETDTSEPDSELNSSDTDTDPELPQDRD